MSAGRARYDRSRKSSRKKARITYRRSSEISVIAASSVRKTLATAHEMDMIGRIKDMTAADTPRHASRKEPTIAAGFVRGLLELAVVKGADRAELLALSGIEAEALHDQDARIPLARWVALMRIGSEASGDPALALHFGEAFDLADMSVLGLM